MLLAAALAVSLAAAPKPYTEVASVEGLSEYRLPNGFRVILVPDPSKPTTTVNLTVFVGSRMEDYGEKGMAHLFEHMLFKKTKKIPDIKKALTEHGADANGTTWYDRTNYFETFPASDANLKWAIDMEAERLVNAIISREALAPEMTVVRNEFEMGETRPMNVVMERVMSAAFQWHNYGDDTIGARSDIEKVPADRLTDFYRKYYQPDNAMLVVAGKFDEKKAFQWIAQAFGRIPKPKRTLVPTYTEEPTQDGEKSVTVRRVGGTPVLMAGYHVPAGTDPDFAAVDVLDSVVGSSPSGRLYRAMVEPKKAARVFCFAMQLAEPGYFLCGAELREKDDPAAARAALLSTVESLSKQPVTQQELDRAKAELLKGYELLLNTSERIGITLSEFAAMGDWRMLFLHRDRIKAVTLEDVNRVAQKYFIASNRTLGEYVPTEKPARAEVPALVDLAPVLKEYKGGEALAKGEVFDATPENIDTRTFRSTLVGGLKVALLPKKTRGETVNAVLWLRYGSEGALMNKSAANELTAMMLPRGTKKHTRQQFKDALDKLSAQLSFVPQPQGVAAHLEVRRPQLMEALELMAEALTEPAFDAKEFEALKREVLARAEKDKSDPMALGFTSLQRALSPFPKGHPLYVESIPERIADVTAVKPEELKSLHATFYGANNGRFAMVGDFDQKEVSDFLTNRFGKWKSSQPFTRLAKKYAPVKQVSETVPVADKPMAFFGAGQIFPMKDTDADYPALTLANYMLGGGFLSGRVPQRLREKEGLSYGAGTYLRIADEDDLSLLGGYAIYAPANVEKVETGFLEEVTKAVASGFTPDELKQARAGLLQKREQGRADDGELAGDLADQLDIGRTMAFEADVDAKLKKVTLQEVGEALKKHVDPKKLSIIKVGDFKTAAAPK